MARCEHLHNNSTVPRSSSIHFAAQTLYIRLLRINLLTFDIGEIEEGDFFVKFKIRNKDDGFQWLLVSVYGAAQPSLKESFLTKLAHLCAKDSLPMILRGDFNIIRGPREKSNSNYNDRWPFFQCYH